jgi:bifunctional UDP-N-acetylglucosamine pyrophosphorylase/glucosamine-1-phosphate N-acetyltransferase
MRSDLPKALHPLAGRPMLAHVLETARALRPNSVHIVYGHRGDLVREAFPDPELSWCLQREQLGTGHAVEQAMPKVADGDRVLVLCGDVPLVRPETLELLIAEDKGPIVVLTAQLEDPAGYGRIVRAEDGAVTGIVEEKEATRAQLAIDEINTGIMAVDAGLLRGLLRRIDNRNSQGEFYLTDVIALAVAGGHRVEAVRADHAKEVIGINDRAQLACAERIFQKRWAHELMARGVTLADPDRIEVRGTVTVGCDVFVDVGAVLEGEVDLADGVRIGPYCVLRDTKLGAGTVVLSHSNLCGASIGERCEIGPFARLRPGSDLADRVKAGNFVEIKKSRISVGSKINHLTYIGDARIGERVNVGAGTVTCNYDGANKHVTRIGNDVFIGSGAMLVAPVRIADGATIGAGSTITKDVGESELSLGRARQVSVDGWKRPTKKGN